MIALVDNAIVADTVEVKDAGIRFDAPVEPVLGSGDRAAVDPA